MQHRTSDLNRKFLCVRNKEREFGKEGKEDSAVIVYAIA